mgnify:CR=1 FL=1
MKIPTLNAHALGGWHGRTYVNSKEAFETSYKLGYRHFEVDISCTVDGHFVAKHGSCAREAYTKDDFLSNSSRHETRMLLEDVVSLLDDYGDMRIMFDFHPCYFDRTAVAQMERFLKLLPQGEKRKRCIVESYSTACMEPVVRDCGVIPMFGWTITRGNLSEAESSIATVSGCVDWCVAHGVKLISIGRYYLVAHPEVGKLVKSKGLTLYSAGWSSYDDLLQAGSIGVDFATVDFLVPGGRVRNYLHAYLKRGVWRRVYRYLNWFSRGSIRWEGGGKRLVPIDTEGMQQVTLRLMKDIHNFCEKHELTYFLAYGSLIGAFRHRGPIPWDDDMDIYMPRPDFEKFCATFPDTWYSKLVTPDRGAAPMPFARLFDTLRTWAVAAWKFAPEPTGCCIDIFPLDGASADLTVHQEKMRMFNEIKQKLIVLRLRLSWILSKACNVRRRQKPKLLVKSQILYPLKKKSWMKKAREIMLSESYETSDWVTNYCDTDHRDRVHMPKSWFADKILVPYADAQFYAPIGYDEHLRNYFGDYMTPPKKVERKGSHFLKVGWLA